MKDSPKIQCCRTLARDFPAEYSHLAQVERLASALFIALQPIHAMPERAKEILSCAALLHDIGISVDYAGHHKHSMRLILGTPLPALSDREKTMVALVARYHRKANPSQTHEAFAALPVEIQIQVSQLASLLRMADGLDRAHEGAVTGMEVRSETPKRWIIKIWGPGDLSCAAWGAGRKSGLFEEIHELDVVIEPGHPDRTQDPH